MEISQASCAKEVVDLYQQIKLKIESSGLSDNKIKNLAIAGKNTEAIEFMKLHTEPILAYWRSLIELGVETDDQVFLHVLLCGLRKVAPDIEKEQMADFLTLHDRRIEKEFAVEINGIHNTHTREQLEEIVSRYTKRRSSIHQVAKEQLKKTLRFDHHAKPA